MRGTLLFCFPNLGDPLVCVTIHGEAECGAVLQ